MSGFVWVLGATSDAPSSTRAPEAFIRRARIKPAPSKATTNVMLTAGGRMLNRPPAPVAISTLTSRWMDVTKAWSALRLSRRKDAPRSTSSAGIKETSTSISSPTPRFTTVAGETSTDQSVRWTFSLSTRTAVNSALSGVLPSFRTMKISVRPLSREIPCRIPSPALLAVMLPKAEGKTPTVTVSDASTKRPLFVALTLMRTSKASSVAAACAGGISPNRTIFSSRGSR